MNPPYSPYQIPTVPPSGYWLGPIDELLAPARRASTLMIVLAGLGLLSGACMMGVAFLPLQQVIRDSNIDTTEFTRANLSPERVIKTMFIIMSSLGLCVSATLLIMAFFVRRGGAASAIVSIVMVSLLVVIVGFLTVVQVIKLVVQPNVPMIGSTGLWCVALGLLILLIVWLAGAVRASGQLKNLKQQQLAQWYAMQHHPVWTGYAQPPQQSS